MFWSLKAQLNIRLDTECPQLLTQPHLMAHGYQILLNSRCPSALHAPLWAPSNSTAHLPHTSLGWADFWVGSKLILMFFFFFTSVKYLYL